MSNDFKDLFGDWEPPKDGQLPEDKAGLPGEPENYAPRELNEKEMKIIGVFEHIETGTDARAQTFVLLQDEAGRRVPIWIGSFEATSISVALEGHRFDRPMTHDLLRVLIDRLGYKVDKILIDDLWQETFYAKLVLSMDEKVVEVDCRPSDAVAVAVRVSAPIFMAEAIIESVEQKF